MAGIKWVFNLFEKVFLGFWGLTIIDLLPIFEIGVLNDVDSTIKTIMALVGAIYLVVQLPFKVSEMKHKKQMNKLEKSIKIQELQKIKRENNETI